MNETNQIQKQAAGEIQSVSDLAKNNQGAIVPVEQQFGLSLAGLTEEQQQALRFKMLESCVDLKVEAIGAQNLTVISSAEMNNTIQSANALSQTKADYIVSSEHKTATGTTNIKVASCRNTSLGLIICILGIILIIVIAKWS